MRRELRCVLHLGPLTRLSSHFDGPDGAVSDLAWAVGVGIALLRQTDRMGKLLKDMVGDEVVHRVACDIVAVYEGFDVAGFKSRALIGFDDLELTGRCRQIGAAMADFLPGDRERAIDILIASLGPELENCDPADMRGAGGSELDGSPMSGFFYLAHSYFVADLGCDDFEKVMTANYEITKRATSEFSIRTPLRDEPEATLRRLETWAHDPNVHVRRLVSEGSRPRLPWSFRLRAFQEDPSPVIKLLELLKDDPVEYVRRSVANNLNDISKDNPLVVVEVARRWWDAGDYLRRRLVRHSLRTLIKAGDLGALDVLGYTPSSPVTVGSVQIEPLQPSIGGKVKIEVRIDNPSEEPAGALVDIQVHFVKANGSTSPKVFKGGELALAPMKSGVVRKSISVAQQSTRTLYPGVHDVEVLINGAVVPIGQIHLRR